MRKLFIKFSIYSWNIITGGIGSAFGKEVDKMIPDEIKKIVKDRYSKFAESGGGKDSC